MAEDLRLLYVALTRSVYHCSIGIAPLFRGTRKKQGETDLHRSALGYLVQGQAGDAAYLQERLQQLAGGGIALSLVEPPDEAPGSPCGAGRSAGGEKLYPADPGFLAGDQLYRFATARRESDAGSAAASGC